jgi:membrane-bound lytic murein transglycosylase D
VPRFLATLHILNDPEKYGLDKIEVAAPMAFETVSFNKKAHLRDIAKTTGIGEQELKGLNPELRHDIVPGEGYALRVPPRSGGTVTAKLGDIPEYKKSEPARRAKAAYAYYRVRSGDTLSTIARRHHTSVRKIMRANNLRRSKYIRVGQKLKIPQKGASVKRKTDSGKRVYAKAGTHVVRHGDSLWLIARRYGTSTQKIMAANGLKSSRLQIGQKLKIPGRRSSKTAKGSSGNYKTYRVKSGDSPFRIAQNHKMPLEQFLRINSLTPRSRIYPGQTVHVE